MAGFNVAEQRTIIKLCASLGKFPVDTMKVLSTATGKPSVCLSLVNKLHKSFADGRNSAEEDVLIYAELGFRVSVRELSDRIDVVRATIDIILKERLKVDKWIPQILTEESKKTRVSARISVATTLKGISSWTTLLDVDLLGFERTEDSPYSSDLPLMGSEIFPLLKKELRGVRHADCREFEMHMQEVVRRLHSR